MTEQQIPKGYKLTEVGVIPEDWEVKSIGEITDCTAGGTPNTRISKYWGGDHRWMSSGELYIREIFDVVGRITDEGLFNSSTKYIPKNSILIGLAGQGKTRGTVAINRIKLCTNQSIAAIFPSKQYIVEYLFYNLDSRYDELRAASTGDGGRGGLNLTIIKKLKIALPLLEEQTAIANALSDTDALINQLKKLITKKQAIKTATMQQLLTGKMRLPEFACRVDGSLKGTKISELGEIPDDWDINTLGGIAKIEMGQSPKSNYYNNKGIGLPLIQGNADILDRKTIIRNYTSVITKRAYPSNIILSVRAPVGEVAVSTMECCIGRGVCAIKYESTYLYHWLVLFEPKWGCFSKGSTFDSINSYELKGINITLPKSLEEQTAIATILTEMDQEITLLETRLSKTEQIKQGMMQQLLTGKIRLI